MGTFEKGYIPWNKGRKETPEMIAKRADATRKAMKRPEVQANMSVSRKGRTKSLEHRAKISAGEKGKVVSEEAKAKMRGRKWTEEAKANMSTAQKARWQNWPEEKRQAQLERIRDAAPSEKNYQSWIEDYYAQQLDAQGIAYERQKKIGWYLIDFYIESENRVIEINGCYWHCCEQCGYTETFPGKSEKDEKRHAYLRRKGYVVDVIWEHDLPRKPRQ